MIREEWTDERVAADLVTALLAVNGWTIEGVYAIRDGLQREGMFELHALRSKSMPEVARRLHAAGYSCGNFMCSLLADRLQAVAATFNGEAAREVKTRLESERAEELDQLLLSMHGVGPTVLRNFKILIGLGQ